MTRYVLETSCLLALLCVAACNQRPNEHCIDCGRDAADSAPATRDAGPGDAASGSDASASDAAPLDTGASSDGGALEDGAAVVVDGSELDADLIECRVEADCVLPAPLLGCERCQDGSSVCPEVHCVEGFCATLIVQPCAERRPSETCMVDNDCARPACKLLCQGDGRSACLPSRCRGGVCVPSFGTCGLSLEPCPEGNQAGRECGACDEDGGCSFDVLGCFDACDAGAPCPNGEACVGGLCQLTTCPPA
jgi:hypothetical protein